MAGRSVMTFKYMFVSLFILVCTYYGVTMYKKYAISQALVARAIAYTQSGDDSPPTLLVLGDSTGVGVGAETPDDSIAALLGKEIHATHVENYAVSGATVNDLHLQLRHAKLKEYTYILIAIGGNDIIRFHSVDTESTRLKTFLTTLPKVEHLIVHSSGNVGGATFFPWFIRPLHTRLNLKYHKAFEDAVSSADGIYVNFYMEPSVDPFSLHPEIYLAADGLHPSTAGYQVWLQKIKVALQGR